MAARHLVGESSSSLGFRSMLRHRPSAAFRRPAAVRLLTTAADEHVGAYLLLSRVPTVLPAPAPFESAFYAYNAKLHEAMAQPFPRELYYKKGSAAETQFLADEQERKAMMTGAWIGGEANGKQQHVQEQQENGEEAATTTTTESTLDGVYAFGVPVNGLQGYAIAPRRTQADRSNDVLSLERKLDRTLFLVVKGASAGPSWTLPYARVPKDGVSEGSLHKAAPKSAYELLGRDMDIWMVTNLPVGVIAGKGRTPSQPSSTSNLLDSVTLLSQSDYVMRAHILAGQPVPVKDDIQFAWLTREEMQERLDTRLWDGVEDLLSA